MRDFAGRSISGGLTVPHKLQHSHGWTGVKEMTNWVTPSHSSSFMQLVTT